MADCARARFRAFAIIGPPKTAHGRGPFPRPSQLFVIAMKIGTCALRGPAHRTEFLGCDIIGRNINPANGTRVITVFQAGNNKLRGAKPDCDLRSK